MSRTRKNPEIRRKQFIDAAQQLFFNRGFKSVSIQEILDAVGDRSVSPSVFYYYFESKEKLYQAVMENYCDNYINLMEECFTKNEGPVELRFLNSVKIMRKTMIKSLERFDNSESMEHRLLTLDLRDRTTRRISELIADALENFPLPGKSYGQKRYMAMYIAGGTGEIISRILSGFEAAENDIEMILLDIMQFTADLMNIPPDILKKLIEGQENECKNDC